MFDKIFVSPQMKRIVIISNKHGIYELPHQLHSVLPLPGIRGGGMIPASSARQGGQLPNLKGQGLCHQPGRGGATAKPQEPGWGHIQGGKMI